MFQLKLYFIRTTYEKRVSLFPFISFVFLLQGIASQAQQFSFEAVRGCSFPGGLTASAQGSWFAWVLDEQGRRNVNLAGGLACTPRKLTNYYVGFGPESTGLSFPADGLWVVYVRGGEPGAV